MKQPVQSPSKEFLKEINIIFHPNPDGSFYINHSCFDVDNHIVIPNQIYLLYDYSGDSVSSIIPFKLQDILIVNEFIMIVGIDMTTGEELGRNEYLTDNKGCAFKLVDFENPKDILNRTGIQSINEYS
jgi:hypothetical protein